MPPPRAGPLRPPTPDAAGSSLRGSSSREPARSGSVRAPATVTRPLPAGTLRRPPSACLGPHPPDADGPPQVAARRDARRVGGRHVAWLREAAEARPLPRPLEVGPTRPRRRASAWGIARTLRAVGPPLERRVRVPLAPAARSPAVPSTMERPCPRPGCARRVRDVLTSTEQKSLTKADEKGIMKSSYVQPDGKCKPIMRQAHDCPFRRETVRALYSGLLPFPLSMMAFMG